ncbi:MAG: hypothetical protein Kow0031_23960 [Anaerolineae bacterium]
MKDDWLDELDSLYEQDKAQQQQIDDEIDVTILNRPSAADLLRDIGAMKLLRRVQSLLLRGGGTLDVYERNGPYDRAVTLVWQGSISNARRPDPEDPSDYYFIAIGVKGQHVYVNDRLVKNPTPEALKEALVAAAKQPGHQKRKAARVKRLSQPRQ